MKITILCSEKNHPIIDYLNRWIELNSFDKKIDLVYSKSDLSDGDILFLISCHEIISKKTRDNYKRTLVIHASDLPKGRGWSPYVWELIMGSNKITVSLLKAEDELDSGEIYKKINIDIKKHELWDEINQKLFTAEIQLIDYAVNSFDALEGVKQNNNEVSSFYPRRTPDDSRIDVKKSIEEQFNKLRILDPIRYPAFFEIYGHKYKIRIDKINE